MHFKFNAVALLTIAATSIRATSVPTNNVYNNYDSLAEFAYQDKEANLFRAISKFLGSGAATKLSNGITISGGAAGAAQAIANSGIKWPVPKPPTGNPFNSRRSLEDEWDTDKEANLFRAISKFLGSGAATKLSNGITISGGAAGAAQAIANSGIKLPIPKPPTGNPFNSRRSLEDEWDADKEANLFRAVSKFLGSGAATKISNAITIGGGAAGAAGQIANSGIKWGNLIPKPPGGDFNPFNRRDLDAVLRALGGQ